MIEREMLTEKEEVVVFEGTSEILNEVIEARNIKDIPGTSHEKLVKLAEML